jgi:hypothetical protein
MYCGHPTTDTGTVTAEGIGYAPNCGGLSCNDKAEYGAIRQRATMAAHDTPMPERWIEFKMPKKRSP